MTNVRSLATCIAAATFFGLAIHGQLKAAVILTNPITDANPSAANPFTAGQTVAPNISASGIGRGAGITANAGGNRYNAASWSLASLDATDYFTLTLSPNASFEIDYSDFVYTGQRSSTGPNSFAFRSSVDGFAADIGSPTATGTTLSLAAAAFQNTTSAIEFRLYGWGGTGAAGTFSVNDFTFNGTISALVSGNNSIITAPAAAAFGRVMVGQTPTVNFDLTKTGSDATTYASTPSNGGIAVVADGSIAGGSQMELVGVQLQNNANGSAASGLKSYTATFDNTAANSAAAGQGSADPNDVANIGATVVANRAISASAVNLGNVIVGAAAGPQLATLTTVGDDDNNTRVTVNGISANDGLVTVAAGSSQLFDGAGDSVGRNVSGSFATAGSKSGSVPLSVAGEGLAGEAVGGVSVAYTANAYDASSAAFLSNSGTTLSLDFGSFAQGSGVQTLGEAIVNLLQTAGFTAELDFDSIVGSGDAGVLFTDLANGEFSALAAGAANAYGFLASFDTNNAPGSYSATYTLGLSDADVYAGAGAADSQSLTLSLSGAITVPEPSAILLMIVGCTVAALTGQRRRTDVATCQ